MNNSNCTYGVDVSKLVGIMNYFLKHIRHIFQNLLQNTISKKYIFQSSQCQVHNDNKNRTHLNSNQNITCVFHEAEDFEVALIGLVLSVLLLASVYLISLFMLTLFEAEKCKKNMKKLGKIQREFIITPGAVSGLHYYTPRHSKIGIFYKDFSKIQNQ